MLSIVYVIIVQLSHLSVSCFLSVCSTNIDHTPYIVSAICKSPLLS